MHSYEWGTSETLDEAEFPLRSIDVKLKLNLDFGGVEVPFRASRAIALRALRQLLDDLQPEDLRAKEGQQEPVLEERSAAPAGGGAAAPGQWDKPDGVDMRVIRSAHRMVQEVSKRSQTGRAVLASELVGLPGLSAPTVGRLLREGEAINDYLMRFVLVTPAGRTKAIDLTPSGRVLASKIRAGVVPS
ncbi:MAG: hypothetical protein ACPGQL_09235 [Thermoplasmatota archaeon]